MFEHSQARIQKPVLRSIYKRKKITNPSWGESQPTEEKKEAAIEKKEEDLVFLLDELPSFIEEEKDLL